MKVVDAVLHGAYDGRPSYAPPAHRLLPPVVRLLRPARLGALDSGTVPPLALPIAIDRPACGKCLRALRAVNVQTAATSPLR